MNVVIVVVDHGSSRPCLRLDDRDMLRWKAIERLWSPPFVGSNWLPHKTFPYPN